MVPFTSIFCIALVLNVFATLRSSSYWNKYKHLIPFCSSSPATSSTPKSSESSSPSSSELSNPTLIAKHSSLLRKYLCVYLLAVLSDWFQGPYVYALYDQYGYTQHEIAVLFVAGFGSSMVFGTFIGGLADSCGRRKFTVLFCLIYIASCVTKHFNHFGILMLGRLLGGVATSLLFSVFDSWLIKSHAEAGVMSFLSKSFAAAQYGNSIVAILAGLAANHAASYNSMVPVFKDGEDAAAAGEDGEKPYFFIGGYLNPFDMALIVLVFAAIITVATWDENYGERRGSEEKNDTNNKPWHHAFSSAFKTTIQSKEILFTGLICSLFEGSMYIFVFMWTPAMKELTKSHDLPFGIIFATFMVCCMAGSSVFSVLINSYKVEQIGVYVLATASIAFAFMTFSSSAVGTFVAFLLFETTVGVYFPTMGTMKSMIVPESKRAAIYNLYRIPLNCIVLFSLLTDLSPKQSFILCTLMLSSATFLQTKLISYQKGVITSSASPESDGSGNGDKMMEDNDLELGATAGSELTSLIASDNSDKEN